MPKGRILAVDDQRYFRELLEGMLGDAGFEVQTAASGDEALLLLEHASFDILLTDLVMPQMDGNELVHRVKQRFPDQDIVVVTGVVDAKAAVNAMKLGACEYLLKPFDRETLTNALEGVLQSRRLQKEHAKLLNENIEYLDERSLLQRATALFGFLTIEPLAERIIDGLCFETGAQGGVLWIASDPASGALELVSARGLVRVDGEQERVTLSDLPSELTDSSARSAVLNWGGGEGGERRAVYLALREETRMIGLIRLTDKLGGEDFDPLDRDRAEKFAEFAQTALSNALRYRALERKSAENSSTGTTDLEFFQNAARSEIEKASRHGRYFSIVEVRIGSVEALRVQFGDAALRQWIGKAINQLTRLQRSSDLLSTDGSGRFLLLLPETGALGAAMFKQRAFDDLGAGEVASLLGPGGRGKIQIATASYPSDGTQLESLLRLLDERIENEASGPVRGWRIEDKPIAGCLDALLEQGAEAPCETVAQIAEFVLSEPGRRPESRSLLLASPGEMLGAVLASGLDALRAQSGQVEVAVLGEPPKRDAREPEGGAIRWVPVAGRGKLPLFLIYFGEGCAYAMICEDAAGRDRARFFQTSDRNLVEHLALRAQRELYGVGSDRA